MRPTAPKDGALPPLAEGQTLSLKELEPKQHFTQPPPRFTEASLVRELEEKGIGRPSTYASILSTLQDKDYVVKLGQTPFVPLASGHGGDRSFGGELPQGSWKWTSRPVWRRSLDRVEEGREDWRQLLKDFYGPFFPGPGGRPRLRCARSRARGCPPISNAPSAASP